MACCCSRCLPGRPPRAASAGGGRAWLSWLRANVLLMVHRAHGVSGARSARGSRPVPCLALARLRGRDRTGRCGVRCGVHGVPRVQASSQRSRSPRPSNGIRTSPDATSIGRRLDWYENTLKIIRDYPAAGSGDGRLSQGLQRPGCAVSTGIATRNPHNQYLLTTAELGVVGLAALLLFFYCHARASARLPDPAEPGSGARPAGADAGRLPVQLVPAGSQRRGVLLLAHRPAVRRSPTQAARCEGRRIQPLGCCASIGRR